MRIDKPAPYVQMVIEGRIAHRRSRPAGAARSTARLVAVSGIDEGAVVVAGSVGPLREGTRRAPRAGAAAP